MSYLRPVERDSSRDANVAKALWDGSQKSDGLGPVSLLDGNLMSGLISCSRTPPMMSIYYVQG